MSADILRDRARDHDFYRFALGLLRAQQRMLVRWSEGDDAVKRQLWRDLHTRGEELFLASVDEHRNGEDAKRLRAKPASAVPAGEQGDAQTPSQGTPK